MAEPVGARRRIDVLEAVRAEVTPGLSDLTVIAFGSLSEVIEPGQRLPEPAGGTALHRALVEAARFQPQQVVIISDGLPDDREAALAAARALGCQIITYHCGDEIDFPATSFLRALAWCSSDGRGFTSIADLRKPERLKSELRLLLAGPR